MTYIKCLLVAVLSCLFGLFFAPSMVLAQTSMDVSWPRLAHSGVACSGDSDGCDDYINGRDTLPTIVWFIANRSILRNRNAEAALDIRIEDIEHPTEPRVRRRRDGSMVTLPSLIDPSNATRIASLRFIMDLNDGTQAIHRAPFMLNAYVHGRSYPTRMRYGVFPSVNGTREKVTPENFARIVPGARDVRIASMVDGDRVLIPHGGGRSIPEQASDLLANTNASLDAGQCLCAPSAIPTGCVNASVVNKTFDDWFDGNHLSVEMRGPSRSLRDRMTGAPSCLPAKAAVNEGQPHTRGGKPPIPTPTTGNESSPIKNPHWYEARVSLLSVLIGGGNLLLAFSGVILALVLVNRRRRVVQTGGEITPPGPATLVLPDPTNGKGFGPPVPAEKQEITEEEFHQAVTDRLHVANLPRVLNWGSLLQTLREHQIVRDAIATFFPSPQPGAQARLHLTLQVDELIRRATSLGELEVSWAGLHAQNPDQFLMKHLSSEALRSVVYAVAELRKKLNAPVPMPDPTPSFVALMAVKAEASPPPPPPVASPIGLTGWPDHPTNPFLKQPQAPSGAGRPGVSSPSTISTTIKPPAAPPAAGSPTLRTGPPSRGTPMPTPLTRLAKEANASTDNSSGDTPTDPSKKPPQT